MIDGTYGFVYSAVNGLDVEELDVCSFIAFAASSSLS
jgi:hypothetical protein